MRVEIKSSHKKDWDKTRHLLVLKIATKNGNRAVA